MHVKKNLVYKLLRPRCPPKNYLLGIEGVANSSAKPQAQAERTIRG